MEHRRREVLAVAVAMVVQHRNQVTAAFAWIDLPKYAMALAGLARKFARHIPAACDDPCRRDTTGSKILRANHPSPAMPDFGPYVRYSDPRVYDLIAGHHWDPFRRSLLLGQHSWSDVRMNRWQTMALCGVQSYLTERGIRIVRSTEHTRDVVLIEVDLPPGDDLVPTRLAEWGISIDKVEVLSFEGPVETVGDVPIFKAVVFGHTEHADGRKRHGINPEAWIVGRMDVRWVERLPEPWVWRSFVGAVVAGDDRVRGSLRKARNTARRVSVEIVEWDEYCVWKEAKDRAVAEATRRAAEAAEPVDEGLMSFKV